MCNIFFYIYIYVLLAWEDINSIAVSAVSLSKIGTSLFSHLGAVSETWHLVSQGGNVDGPPPRHKHSAVLHDSAMWVYGGMTDLQERSDFWRFDFGKEESVDDKEKHSFIHHAEKMM